MTVHALRFDAGPPLAETDDPAGGWRAGGLGAPAAGAGASGARLAATYGAAFEAWMQSSFPMMSPRSNGDVTPPIPIH